MNVEHAACKALVSKFIENPISWSREIKISKKLLSMSPDLDSWAALNLPHKISSLAFFLTEDGKMYIPESARNPYLLDFDKLAPKSNKNKLEVLINE